VSAIADEERRRCAHPSYLVDLEPGRSINHSSLETHGQCNVRPTVTFPALGHHQSILLGDRSTCV